MFERKTRKKETFCSTKRQKTCEKRCKNMKAGSTLIGAFPALHHAHQPVSRASEFCELRAVEHACKWCAPQILTQYDADTIRTCDRTLTRDEERMKNSQNPPSAHCASRTARLPPEQKQLEQHMQAARRRRPRPLLAAEKAKPAGTDEEKERDKN